MKSLIASTAPWRAALLALAMGASLITGQTAAAQATANPPERMTYQGFLVDGNGTALGNSGPKNYDVIFRIWAGDTTVAANDRLWSEQQTVTVDKGYFSVLLGEGTAVGSELRPALSTLFKGATASDRFVAITVKGIGAGGANVDIQPRLRLLTSPYAYLATQATKLVRADNSNDLLSSSGNVMTLAGEIDITGINSIEFGSDVPGKQGDGGRIAYGRFTPGVLDIVGGGTTAANRAIKFWTEGGATFSGPVSATSFNGPHTGDGSGLTGVAKLGANTFTGYQEFRNNVRLGELVTTLGAAGWGEALILSGAPPIASGYDSDNSDPLWLARYNTAANASELRMVIGDDPGSDGDRFVIGTMQGSGNFSQAATWAPQVTIDARGFMGLNGRVPEHPLHFPNTLGDKVVLWGGAGGGVSYGLGIQSGTLQIHTGSFSDGVAFGYGTSASMTETARINGDALYVYHSSVPQVQLRRPDGRYAQFYRDGASLILSLNLSNHDANHRYALYNGDANWDFGSDRKLKKDIVDAQPVLDRALQVRVRNFLWKDSGTDSRPMIGVVAQELQPLFPDMVSHFEDPVTHEDTLTVGYGDFAVIAIKALQEFKAKHDEEIRELKSQIAELKDLRTQVGELQAQMKDVVQAAAALRNEADKATTTASLAK